MEKKDLTEGIPFWKWFFSQIANIFICIFWILAIVVIYYNIGGLFVDSGTTFSTLFVTVVMFLNLILSYRHYKQLKNGISK